MADESRGTLKIAVTITLAELQGGRFRTVASQINIVAIVIVDIFQLYGPGLPALQQLS